MATFTKEITVEVPKGDQSAKHDRLAEVDREILDVQAEKADANGDFNKQLKDLRNEQKAILDTLATGKETISVECEEVIDEQRLEMVTKRVDTGETLHEFTRPLTPEERQTRFGADEEENPTEAA